MRIEPSKRLSELCGFPYFVEKRFTVKEALENGLVNECDLKQMKKGEICKSLPMVK